MTGSSSTQSITYTAKKTTSLLYALCVIYPVLKNQWMKQWRLCNCLHPIVLLGWSAITSFGFSLKKKSGSCLGHASKSNAGREKLYRCGGAKIKDLLWDLLLLACIGTTYCIDGRQNPGNNTIDWRMNTLKAWIAISHQWWMPCKLLAHDWRGCVISTRSKCFGLHNINISQV